MPPTGFACKRLSSILGMALLAVASAPAAPEVPFLLASRDRHIPEVGVVQEAVLCTARHEFALIPPPGWKIGIEPGQSRLTWLSRDRAALIKFELSWNKTQQTPMIDPASVLATLLERHPGARVRDQFICYTGSGQGLAAEVEEDATVDARRIIRMAAIPFPGGMAEVTLISSVAAFPEHQHVLGGFLNSLQIGQRAPPRAPAEVNQAIREEGLSRREAKP